MQRLIVLGTGNALATRCYNTCFAIENEQGQVLLVDAGGGNGILRQLEQARLDPGAIHELIVTHAHCDHILGVVWIVRKLGTLICAGAYEGNLRIHCSARNAERIRAMCAFTLEQRFVDLFDRRILFCPVEDGSADELYGQPVRFFDIHSAKEQQYGFRLKLRSGQTLVCLGDEPYRPACRDSVAGAQWLLCEAFCLYADRDRFKPYEKQHSTVKDASQLAESLAIPNLVLWHTEDKTLDTRQEAYTAEAKEFYTGRVFVPEDLDVIALD